RHQQADLPVGAGRQLRWRGGRQHDVVLRRQRDRARCWYAVDDERDVDRPVGTAFLTELACAIERIDGPHAFALEAYEVVIRFLGQDRVVRSFLAEQCEDQLVRALVALVARCAPRPQVEQQLPRGPGGAGRELVIVHYAGSTCRAARRRIPASTGLTSM